MSKKLIVGLLLCWISWQGVPYNWTFILRTLIKCMHLTVSKKCCQVIVWPSTWRLMSISCLWPAWFPASLCNLYLCNLYVCLSISVSTPSFHIPKVQEFLLSILILCLCLQTTRDNQFDRFMKTKNRVKDLNLISQKNSDQDLQHRIKHTFSNCNIPLYIQYNSITHSSNVLHRSDLDCVILSHPV